MIRIKGAEGDGMGLEGRDGMKYVYYYRTNTEHNRIDQNGTRVTTEQIQNGTRVDYCGCG